MRPGDCSGVAISAITGAGTATVTGNRARRADGALSSSALSSQAASKLALLALALNRKSVARLLGIGGRAGVYPASPTRDKLYSSGARLGTPLPHEPVQICVGRRVVGLPGVARQ